LQLQGRLDGAINSGGETVFPEQVEQRFLALCRRLELPVEELLLLPEPDPLWGERLVALVRLPMGLDAAKVLEALVRQALKLPVSQRPWRWLLCQHLHRTALGKWERARWCHWLASQPSQPHR
jgi:O-succinylbenzoic acid--CoA ligase